MRCVGERKELWDSGQETNKSDDLSFWGIVGGGGPGSSPLVGLTVHWLCALG